MSPWLWIAVGIALAALEMLASGVYLLWIGLGAIATGLIVLALPGLSQQQQLVLFAVLAVVAAVAGARAYRRMAGSDEPKLNRRGEQMIGTLGTLDEAIVNGHGRVRIGDTMWRVRGPDLPAGTRVRVTGSDAAVLTVESAGAARGAVPNAAK